MLLFLGVPKVFTHQRGRCTKHSQETGQETGGYYLFTVKSGPLGMRRFKSRHPDADDRLPSQTQAFQNRQVASSVTAFFLLNTLTELDLLD